MSAPRIRYRLNVRAAQVLTGLGLVAVVGLYFLGAYQEDRVLRSALEQVKGFRAAIAAEEDPDRRARDSDLALRHVNQYLAARPDDPEGLEIQAQLLAKIDSFAAIQAYEHLLRVQPKGARAQEARRRLAELDIGYSLFYLGQKYARLLPENTAKNLKFHAAEVVTDQLLDPKAEPRVDDAEAHRLRAMALEGQILPAKSYRPVKDKDGQVVLAKDKDGHDKPVEIELVDYTILEYKAALDRDPGDRAAALGLARVYREKKNDTAAARGVMRRLLEARPDSADVRLACYGFLKDLGDNEAASRELAEAVRLAPGNYAVILTAAEDALQGAHKSTAAARAWLDKIPEDARDEIQALASYERGLIEYFDQRPTQAIGAWTKGLEQAGGTNELMTLRLAFLHLELRNDAKADKLVDQFRRLVGDDDTRLRWLRALQEERDERYGEAIKLLEPLRDDRSLSDRSVQEQIGLIIARCQQRQPGGMDAAEKTYRDLIRLGPSTVATWLALAENLLFRDPAEAARVLEQASQAHPKNPTLLGFLTRARLLEQMARTPEKRNWARFEVAFNRAAAVTPQDDPNLALLRAERVLADDHLDQALQLLERSAAKVPHSAEFAVTMAEVLLRQGHADRALQVLEQASAPQAAGDQGTLRKARARILDALGRGREARALLVRDLANLSPADRADVWKALVLLCQAHGDPDTTHAAYSEWARQLPQDTRPKFALLELAIAAKDEKAVQQRLAELDPSKNPGGASDYDALLWKLAQVRVQLWERSAIMAKVQAGAKVAAIPGESPEGKKAVKLLDEADHQVEELLKEAPTNPVTRLLRGLIREEQGKPKDAIKAYTAAWDGGKGSPDALMRLVDLLTRPGLDEAYPNRKPELDELRRADSTKQIDRVAAMACLRNHDPEEAVRIIEEALGDPGGAKPWQAEIFELLGNSEKAEGVLRKLAEQQPDKVEPWLALVRHQANHDRGAAAAKTVAEFMKSYKTDRPELIEAQFRTAAGDQPGADQAFEAAFRRFPDDRNVLLAAALHFDRTARPARAEAYLRHILSRDPNDRLATRQLAVILSNRPETWAQALALLGPEGAPNDTTEARLARGIVLGRSADAARRKQGTDLLDALVADLPAENPVANIARDILTRLLIVAGQSDRASRVAATSALAGSDPTAIALYAEALLQSGQFKSAETQIERLAKVEAGGAFEANLRARLIQGEALRKLARPSSTAATLEQAYLAREDTPAGEAFGREAFPMLLAMGPDASDVAERMARRLAQHNPALSWMPAMIVIARGRRDEALALCRTAAQAGEKHGDLHESCQLALQIAVASRNEAPVLDQVGMILDAAIGRLPDGQDLLVMKAMFQHLLGHYVDEVRLYRAILEHQPRNPVALNNLAWALSEGLNQPSEALEKIDDLIKITGRQAENLDTRGVILMRMGRIELAIKDLEEVVQAEPTGVHLYHLAHAYQKVGREADFHKAFDQARKAGLTAAMMDPAERAEFEALMSR